MRSMRSAVVGPWACFRLMTVFINLRLVPFQLFASNSLRNHPTANRRLFEPNLSPDQVGTALVVEKDGLAIALHHDFPVEHVWGHVPGAALAGRRGHQRRTPLRRN